MTGSEISWKYRIAMKLAAYEAIHGGKRPARIFVPARVLREIVGGYNSTYHARADGNGELFGVRAVVIYEDSDTVYLSDEEE